MTWRTLPMDEIKASVPYAFVGGPFGSNLTSRDYVDDGVPVIRGNNLPPDAAFLDDEFVFISETKADQLRSNTAYPGDLVFTQRGTLGQVGIIPRQARYERYIISQSQMKVTVNAQLADPLFVYYFFRQPATVQRVINHAATSGVPHINLGVLKAFKITLPDLPIQQRIASILAAYDDQTRNNRQRIELLEKAARLLYEEWFVRLRFPGHEHTATMEGLPEGWERTPLGKLMTLQRGHDLPAQDRIDGEIPVVSSSGITGFHNEKKADAPGVVTGRYGTLGQVYYVDCDYWPLNTALYVVDFNENPALFILHLLQCTLRTMQSDKAAVPGVNRNVLHKIEVLRPPKRLRDSFGEIVEPLYRQITTLRKHSEKLRAARDLLLPRLMSGEIEV